MPLSTERFTRLAFTGALSRQPDAGEVSDWRETLAPMIDSPAALFTAAGVLVADLFESAEYLALSTTDAEYVEDLYLAFFGHVPDPEGQAHWEAEVASVGRTNVLVAFKVSTEFSARIASLYAEPSTSVDPYPTEALGGPKPSKRRSLPPDYKSLGTNHTYADRGISTNTTGDVPPLRWEEEYDGLDEAEAQILLDHYRQARHAEFGFDYVGADGIARADVRYESFDTDHTKTWIRSARVTLVKYPS